MLSVALHCLWYERVIFSVSVSGRRITHLCGAAICVNKNTLCRTGVPFPKNFSQIAKTILKRLFRVYAHIYHQHFSEVVTLREEAHLNTSFKHFIFFVQVAFDNLKDSLSTTSQTKTYTGDVASGEDEKEKE